jgi:ABC transporter substrate binding protein/Reverse transcriptase (RNA-dependent DNA polymerase)
VAACGAGQQALLVVGFIAGPNESRFGFNAGFFQGPAEAGYVEGQNLAIEYRGVESHNGRLPGFVNDLVSRRVAVMAVVDSTAAVLVAKAATQSIPIASRIGGDPVAAGIVPNFNRPGGNITLPNSKDGGKFRVLWIPAIRDRVVQGALKLILEPIFAADFQPGSFGYRTKRTAHDAVDRVARAIVQQKTGIIDIDLRSHFDKALRPSMRTLAGGNAGPFCWLVYMLTALWSEVQNRAA